MASASDAHKKEEGDIFNNIIEGNKVFIIQNIETGRVIFDILNKDHKYDGTLINILAGPLDQTWLIRLAEIWTEKNKDD